MPAQASSNQSINYGGHKRATSSWNGVNDTLTVGDDYADGWGAYSSWVRGARSGTCSNSKGAGFNEYCTYSFAAGMSIHYNICSKDGTVTLACTPGLNDVT